jgi:hypothetical protein
MLADRSEDAYDPRDELEDAYDSCDELEEARVLPDDTLAHPHRRPLRWERTRRPGSVPAGPAHCICPVRAPASGTDERDRRDGLRLLTKLQSS